MTAGQLAEYLQDLFEPLDQLDQDEMAALYKRLAEYFEERATEPQAAPQPSTPLHS